MSKAEESAEIRVRVGLFICQNEKILLARHVKDSREYFMLPGGGVRHGETMVAALKREMKEEGGVSVEGLRLQALCESIEPEGGRHIVHVVFRGERIEGEPRSTGLDHRVAEVLWSPLGTFFNLPFYPDIKDYLLEAAERPVGPLYRELRWLK